MIPTDPTHPSADRPTPITADTSPIQIFARMISTIESLTRRLEQHANSRDDYAAIHAAIQISRTMVSHLDEWLSYVRGTELARTVDDLPAPPAEVPPVVATGSIEVFEPEDGATYQAGWVTSPKLLDHLSNRPWHPVDPAFVGDVVGPAARRNFRFGRPETPKAETARPETGKLSRFVIRGRTFERVTTVYNTTEACTPPGICFWIQGFSPSGSDHVEVTVDAANGVEALRLVRECFPTCGGWQGAELVQSTFVPNAARVPSIPDWCKKRLGGHWSKLTAPVAPGPLPTREENPHGLHARYMIRRIDGEPLDPQSVHFVLRLDSRGKDRRHVGACCEAARAWIASIRRQGHAPMYQTATDLETWMDAHTSPVMTQATRIQNLEAALRKIAKWFDEFPSTGRFYDEDPKRPMSFGSCWGSNGERDFMRQVATDALKDGGV